MLKELTTSQPRGERRRRWFADDYFDLVVWLGADGGVWGFQLCYDRERSERALTWTIEAGYSHNRVDDGEQSPTKNRTPILVPDGRLAADEIAGRFEGSSVGIEAPVRELVLEKLRGASQSGG